MDDHTKQAIRYTPEERAEIISALKRVAVAQAEFWDVLREVEVAHNTEIETDTQLVGEIAGECDHPPSPSDLDNEGVWDSFLAHTEGQEG